MLEKVLNRARTLRRARGDPDVASVFSSSLPTTLVTSNPSYNQELSSSSAYQRAKEVEMEDLWKRNHSLLQEKYTLRQ
jgi:hypothetical protein